VLEPLAPVLAPVLVLEHEPVLEDLAEAFAVMPLMVPLGLLAQDQPVEQNQMWAVPVEQVELQWE
jgi:hypothetical protein